MSAATTIETGLADLLEEIDRLKGELAYVKRENASLWESVHERDDKITELQASSGTVTPEDQAMLDDIESRAAKIADGLTALDALTPPPA